MQQEKDKYIRLINDFSAYIEKNADSLYTKTTYDIYNDWVRGISFQNSLDFDAIEYMIGYIQDIQNLDRTVFDLCKR